MTNPEEYKPGRRRWRDEISGQWVTEVDDNDAVDTIEIIVNLRHRQYDSGDLYGDTLQTAGARYAIPSETVIRSANFAMDESITDNAGALAKEAIRLLLKWRRENHDHVKVRFG